ncbi:MAG: CAF17-like 4Fe-4S cluster assembly/insertion protein YgfZ [Wenzhouxiangella sp.]
MNHLSGLRLCGPDARAFAQSQFTADIDKAGEHHWLPTAWCDPKGRCLSIILLKTHQDDVDLVFPLEQAETLKRLRLFAIGRTVEFLASKQVRASLGAAPERTAAAQVPGRFPRWLWLSDAAEARPADADTHQRWLLADMAAPIPWLGDQTSARFLPQFLDLSTHDGLSFRKGCYPGQEVIARLHFRGTVKYRLSGFLSEDAREPWAAGESLQLDHDSGKLDVVKSLAVDGHVAGLAVTSTALTVGQAFKVTDSQGRPATLQLVTPPALC